MISSSKTEFRSSAFLKRTLTCVAYACTHNRYIVTLPCCPGLDGGQRVTLMLSVLPLQMRLQCSESASSLLSYVMISHDGIPVTPGAPLTAI